MEQLEAGDIWNMEADRIMLLHKKYGILCEDMESISVYTISNLYNVPVISIRVISNNEILNEEYERDLGIESQKIVKELIKVL